mmetsp:Transcript_9428/g.23217  ORF Transcript_9428/g.23217 Transcript_9428/m.23217 type:complete len:95 (-) Transcript_9428:370-654(-)
MQRQGIAAAFALLAFLDWNIVAKLTLIVAVINFITNPDPIARIASVTMIAIMLVIVKCIKRKLVNDYEETEGPLNGTPDNQPPSTSGNNENKED